MDAWLQPHVLVPLGLWLVSVITGAAIVRERVRTLNERLTKAEADLKILRERNGGPVVERRLKEVERIAAEARAATDARSEKHVPRIDRLESHDEELRRRVDQLEAQIPRRPQPRR